MDYLKLKLFKWHLVSSLLIVGGIAFICNVFWFPKPFLLLDGTWIALLILAIVDVILGPLLTLLLVSSKKTKKALWFDLIIILSVQIYALVFGLNQIKQQKVVAIVHFNNTFHLVSEKSLPVNELELYSDKNIKKYAGIKYAMLLSDDVTSYLKKSNENFLYEPTLYRSLNQEEITNKTFPLTKVPEYIKKKYQDTHTFKALAGKERNAIVILSHELDIVDIIPLPT
jgi:phosphoglycerol transferase MdoB-like AlkP superfamily enzyme